MRKHIAVAVALIGTALTSLAQSSANLTLTGKVEDNTSIAVVAQAGYSALPIEAGCVDQTVANVTEKSNSRTGYHVTLSSLNAGTGSQAFLKGASAGNTDTVNYAIKYQGVSVTLSSGAARVTTATARTAQAGVTKTLAVTVPASWVNTDTYNDTLTLTIAAD